MALMLHTQIKSDNGEDIPWDAGSVDGYPWLFVGSLSAAESHEQLRENNVTRLLTVARKLPVASVPEGIDHLRVDIDDHPRANFLAVVAECQDFIDAAAVDANDEERPCSILIHCASGVSRSVTAVVAWLMSPQRGLSLDEALTAVRMNRPLSTPNVGFMCQMQVLDKHGGNLEKALFEWKASTSKDILERAADRRKLANDIHASVDELEVSASAFFLDNVQKHPPHFFLFRLSQVKIQSFRSSKYARNSPLLNFLREANQLSDRLDNGQENCAGLPEDRVAKVIFKSARSKVERLVTTMENDLQRTS
mmetsp:Transcript_14578/g.21517  ORF Transcript_14578/g.21517 Transcript_14578/m.21517 type:complete len:308 (-) Transcript_14578:457-1380(-)